MRGDSDGWEKFTSIHNWFLVDYIRGRDISLKLLNYRTRGPPSYIGAEIYFFILSVLILVVLYSTLCTDMRYADEFINERFKSVLYKLLYIYNETEKINVEKK